jgi:hypothetical protein
MVVPLVAASTSLVFGALSLLHVYWATGGQWASGVVVPELRGNPVSHPGKAVMLFVAFLLGVACVLVGLEADLWRYESVPRWMPHVGTWVIGAVMFVRFVGDFRYVGLFKRVRGTRFARLDTFLYSPLCLVLATSSATVALARAHAG